MIERRNKNPHECHHHRRCVDAILPSFVLLNDVGGGTIRAAFVVPAPVLALILLIELIAVLVLLFVLGDGEDDVGGGRSSTGGKRSLSISDLRLSYDHKVRY